MLQLIKKNVIKKDLKESTLSRFKHFPSSVREWKNSIYLFNKNNLNLIPVTSKYAIKIIKSFFNLYNKNLEIKLRRKRLLLRTRKLSSNRIYLSKGEFKHSNNNVLINIYLFNRQKHNYLSKLKNKYLEKFLENDEVKNHIIELLRNVYSKGIDTVKQVNKDKYLFIKALDLIESKNYKIKTFRSLSNYTWTFYRKYLKLTMKKLRLYFLYKQLIFINKSKLNYTYLRVLKNGLEKIYNKNVELNLINLKRFYLNSDILFESVKLKVTWNKNKMRKIFNKLWQKIKIRKKIFKQGLNVNLEKNKNKKILRKLVISDLKYKDVTGFRLEAKGRLSRRYTASRSVSKLKHKGNLTNIDSSYGKLSSVLLKGNLKSNIQYTKLKSKTRIGAFGLKGWVSGY